MRFEIYRDAARKWRWRLWSANNRMIADSGQGYDSEQSCRHGIALVMGTSNIPIHVKED